MTVIKNNWITAGAIAAAIVLASVMVAQGGPKPQSPPGQAGLAGPGGPRPGGDRFERVLPPPPALEMQRLAEQLGLSEKQKQTIRSLADQKARAIHPLLEQLAPLYKQITDQMLSSKPNAGIAKEAIRQIQSIRGQIAGLGVDFWVNVRANLTPEQNTKLTNLLQQRLNQGWHNFHGWRPGFGRPGRDQNNPDSSRPPSAAEPEPH